MGAGIVIYFYKLWKKNKNLKMIYIDGKSDKKNNKG